MKESTAFSKKPFENPPRPTKKQTFFLFSSAAAPVLLAILLMLTAVSPLRLHVIANSDTEYDQGVKLAVRDAVLAVMNESGGPESFDGAQAAVLQNGGALQAAVDTTLAAFGAEYSGTLYLGDALFPEKVYSDRVYPAGTYKALRVVLGEGGGQNWWCVIYPPLCLGEFQGRNLSEIQDAANEKPVVFRSFFAEIWHKLFGGGETA